MLLFCSASLLLSQTPSPDCGRLESLLSGQKGKPYVWGAQSPAKGFDCSGLIYWVHKAMGKPIPRTTARKYWVFFDGKGFHWRSASCADIVWWQFTGDRPYGHIGIVVNPPAFYQSGSSRGVYSREFFKGSFWDRKFAGAKEGIL